MGVRRNGDGGILLSVVVALDHGCTLHSGVLDNKPPVFYYAGAAGDAGVGRRGVVVPDVGWLAIAGVCTALWLRRVGTEPAGLVTGTPAYPLLLNGVWFNAG